VIGDLASALNAQWKILAGLGAGCHAGIYAATAILRKVKG
jgi:hypothetical protein